MPITASCSNCGKETANWFALCSRCIDKINRNKDKDWSKGYDVGLAISFANVLKMAEAVRKAQKERKK